MPRVVLDEVVVGDGREALGADEILLHPLVGLPHALLESSGSLCDELLSGPSAPLALPRLGVIEPTVLGGVRYLQRSPGLAVPGEGVVEVEQTRHVLGTVAPSLAERAD